MGKSNSRKQYEQRKQGGKPDASGQNTGSNKAGPSPKTDPKPKAEEISAKTLTDRVKKIAPAITDDERKSLYDEIQAILDSDYKPDKDERVSKYELIGFVTSELPEASDEDLAKIKAVIDKHDPELKKINVVQSAGGDRMPGFGGAFSFRDARDGTMKQTTDYATAVQLSNGLEYRKVYVVFDAAGKIARFAFPDEVEAQHQIHPTTMVWSQWAKLSGIESDDSQG